MKKDFNFPLFKTKVAGIRGEFNLEDPKSRKKYFEAKAGQEIKFIRNYLKRNTFVGILLGKKSAGKGTYSKLFKEAIGDKYIAHVSIGDAIRKAHHDLGTKAGKKELEKFLENRYRGFISIKQALDVISGRDTKTLLPTEIALALLEREIDQAQGKAVFIDGFPRNLDQIAFSLFLRSIMGYREDPDFLVFIDLPEQIIDERMKTRVICPNCQTPRNLKLLRTKRAGYDPSKKSFYLICDNESCKDSRMVTKEGDEFGIENIRERVNTDHSVMEKLLGIQGVPKVLLRNSIPVNKAKQYVDAYEITPAYGYRLNADKEVEMLESPWEIRVGKESFYSLLPAPVAVSFIKQVAEILKNQR
ncbi:MAG: hypothetical protein COV31_02325 [Candidatus Yanofskybacteria bacterium CG10_big_fil_rev_8_21_14_0_10_46_23]|uniref:Adenylate kinase n=1 Tax=Candidatus Yanofskybacteria bacterium CG10_big_fil_rev_8_21_14_0_10_46_23 TaxID=1975098 RepID=A0A2H0R3W7_9BACT|nr:MAG: hypothetical protein COV31_02325 [Candidatus Yanofskybacteria bacterium CG10_big_fil_rev_8_21_14_0_10_46_23]